MIVKFIHKREDWNIIDLVIYTATDDTVLAFFHNTGTKFLG